MNKSARAEGLSQPLQHSERDYSPLYANRYAMAHKNDSPLEQGSGRLKSIIAAAHRDDSTDSYVLVELPFETESDAMDILEMTDSLQQRIFMNATGVEMRSTAVRSKVEYNATLIVKAKGFKRLTQLYGNGYKTSDSRDTERQCAQMFESEFALLADHVAQHAYAKTLPPLHSDTDTSEFPAYISPQGLMTVYFVGTERGHELDLNGSYAPSLHG
jgi:hypothetical protein